MPKKSSPTSKRSEPDTPFARAVYRAVSRIPRGETRTYGEVAKAAGRPGAARAVGTIMSRNTDTKRVPCHRVIRKMGDFGHYGEGPARKKAILGWEAVAAMRRAAA